MRILIINYNYSNNIEEKFLMNYPTNLNLYLTHEKSSKNYCYLFLFN